MLRKVEIISPGDTSLMTGEQMEKTQLLEIIDSLKSKNPEAMLPTYKPMLLGITKALVIPNNIGLYVGNIASGFFDLSESIISRSCVFSICSPVISDVSPGDIISTFLNICRSITSICLSLIATP